MGEEPDHSKIYVEAIMEVNKKNKPLFLGYYGFGPANKYYYLNIFENRFTPREEHTPQDETRAHISELQRYKHEFRVFMQGQLDKNNPTQEDIRESSNAGVDQE